MHRHSDIGCMQGKRIVDTVTQKSDYRIATLERTNDPLFLARINFRKN